MSRSNPTSTAQQPMIVKYVQPDRSGIQAHNFTRHSIGYVVRGKKCVYYGDVCHEIYNREIQLYIFHNSDVQKNAFLKA